MEQTASVSPVDMATTVTALFSVAAAVLSGMCAFGSYRLAERIYLHSRLDEKVVLGPLSYPNSVTKHENREAVVCCALFNKSHRKVYVNRVDAFDEKGKAMDTIWSSVIDSHGNPQEPHGLIGIVDVSNLYVRRNDGHAVAYLRIKVVHSFSESPVEAVFDPYWMSSND